MENSIEEDMKILEEFKTHGYAMLLIKYEDRNKTNLKLDQAIEHILSDYKRVLKENEELEEINNELEAEKNEAIRRYNFETIPKQKVKDKIEELDKKVKNYQCVENRINLYQRKVLQELLEGRKI